MTPPPPPPSQTPGTQSGRRPQLETGVTVVHHPDPHHNVWSEEEGGTGFMLHIEGYIDFRFGER